MPAIQNPDGTFTVTDPTGRLVIPGVPPELAPPPSLYAEAPPPPEMPDQRLAAAGGFDQYAQIPIPATPAAPATQPAPMTPEQQAISDALFSKTPTGPAHGAAPSLPPGAVPTSELAGGPSLQAAPAPDGELMQAAPGGPTSEQMARKYLLEERPATPARRVAAHDQLQAFRVEKGLPPLSEEASAAADAGFGRRMEAALKGGEALSKQAEKVAIESELQAERARQEMVDLRARQEAQRQELEPRIQRLDRMIDETRSMQIDPDRYWKRKGAVGTVLAKIGIALGALGSFGQGPNQVAEMIRKEVDDDINAQRTEIDQSRTGFEMERNMLAEMRSQFLSPEAAEAAARSLLLEQSAAEARAMGAEAASVEAQAKGIETAAALADEAAKWRGKVEQLEADTITQQWRHVPERVVGGGGGPLSMEELLKRGRKLQLTPQQTLELATKGVFPGASGADLTRAQVEAAKDARARMVRLPDGDVAYATKGNRADEIQGVLDARSGLRKNFRRMRELAKTLGKSGMPSIKAEWKALVQANKLQMKKLETLGAITEADQKLVSPMVGEDGEKFFKFDSATEATLDAADAHFAHQEQAAKANLYRDPDASQPLTAGVEELPPGAKPK